MANNSRNMAHIFGKDSLEPINPQSLSNPIQHRTEIPYEEVFTAD